MKGMLDVPDPGSCNARFAVRHGLSSHEGASVGLSMFTISDNALVGIQVALDG